MASSLGTTTTASAAAVSVAKSNPNSASSFSPQAKLSFCVLPPKPSSRSLRLSGSSKGVHSSWKPSTVVRAQLNEVTTDGSSSAASKPDVPKAETKDDMPSSQPSLKALASEESISEFLTQVANLVKIVDSRDIVELQLKQLDCELLIRKKEALPQPPASAVMMQSPPPAATMPPAFQAAPPPVPSGPSPTPSSSVASPPALPPAAKSPHPPLKSPMAGTFYRNPAPGAAAFVKVGDKVQKGQVLCIVEAMKLMNEIESDRSGTIVEILLEDGKPVSVDTPLFAIQP